MTPASIPAQLPENHLRGSPCGSLKHCGFLSVLFASDHLPQPEGGKTDHLRKVPDPLCGAVFVGRGAQNDPRPLSCYNFDPSVHLLVFGAAENTGCRTPGHTGLTRLRLRRETACYLLFTRRATQRPTGGHAEPHLGGSFHAAYASLSVAMAFSPLY